MWSVDYHGTSGLWRNTVRGLSLADARQEAERLLADGYGSRYYPDDERPDTTHAFERVGNVWIDFDGPAIGVMGEVGDRTVVRPTTCGSLFAVLTASRPHRLLKAFADADEAREYNASIHGVRL